MVLEYALVREVARELSPLGPDAEDREADDVPKVCEDAVSESSALAFPRDLALLTGGLVLLGILSTTEGCG